MNRFDTKHLPTTHFPRGLNIPSVKHRHAGFTLIELMLSLSLGILASLFIFNVFMAGNINFGLVSSFSNAQQSSRFAGHLLAEDIRMAGYNNALSTIPFVTCPSSSTTGHLGQACNKNSHTETAGDRIAIRFTPNDGRDCLGGIHAADTEIANIYWVKDGDLVCRPFDPFTNRWSGDFTEEQALVFGVDALQVLYGIDTNADFDPNVNQYVALEKVDDWRRVKSMQIAILVNAGNGFGLDQKERVYQLLDANPLTFDDRQLRQIYRKTIELPNSVYGSFIELASQ